MGGASRGGNREGAADGREGWRQAIEEVKNACTQGGREGETRERESRQAGVQAGKEEGGGGLKKRRRKGGWGGE